MKLETPYSSSAGNLYVVTANDGSRLLIDPGVTWKKLQQALTYKMLPIVGCLVSHQHLDHCKAAQDVLNQGIPVYLSHDTDDALDLKGLTVRFIYRTHTKYAIGPFEVTSFPVKHDVPNLGFVISDGDDSMLFAIDTPNIKQSFDDAFQIIALSCNYDRDILQQRVESGEMNEAGAKRLIQAHMEWKNTKRYITEFCNLSKCEQIHLLHMSTLNLNKEAVRQDIEDATFVPTFIGGLQ